MNADKLREMRAEFMSDCPHPEKEDFEDINNPNIRHVVCKRCGEVDPVNPQWLDN